MYVTTKGYKRKYVYGGSGIFETISSLVLKALSSDVAGKFGNAALGVGQSILKDIGKNVVQKVFSSHKQKIKPSKSLSPQSLEILNKFQGSPSSQFNNSSNLLRFPNPKLKPIISTDTLIDGANLSIPIQHLVKKINGTGLKQI